MKLGPPKSLNEGNILIIPCYIGINAVIYAFAFNFTWMAQSG